METVEEKQYAAVIELINKSEISSLKSVVSGIINIINNPKSTAKVCDIFEKDEPIGGYSKISLWKHSNAVALLGKLIYRREFRESGENIYAAGLLHDIGIILEDQGLF